MSNKSQHDPFELKTQTCIYGMILNMSPKIQKEKVKCSQVLYIDVFI